MLSTEEKDRLLDMSLLFILSHIDGTLFQSVLSTRYLWIMFHLPETVVKGSVHLRAAFSLFILNIKLSSQLLRWFFMALSSCADL